MKASARLSCVAGIMVAAIAGSVGGIGAAEPPDAPPVSEFAPAEDLIAQMNEYIDELEEAVEDEGEYDDSKEKLAKDANTVILLAVALGLHDQDNKLKAAAPAVFEAAQQLAAADDYASAKAAVDAVKAALSSEGDPSSLSWKKKNASMAELMKAVPLVNTRLKRYMRRFERYPEDVAGYAAVIAVIGQGSMPNAADTDAPDKVEEWYDYCIQMRDAAGALNAAAHAEDEDAAEKAMEALQKSCDDCHEIFHPDEV